MTRTVNAGALILAGFEGTEPDTPELRDLEALGVGGYILFGRNVASTDQVHALLAGIRDRAQGRPLLFAVDQEGGRVARLRAPLTEWPPMAGLGDTGDIALARDVGAALARELRALGFNVDFAPVLDLRYPQTTDAIGDRSLGSEPELVTRLGQALIEGIQGQGVLACAKHFPGHGHVAVDSHRELPTCSLDGAQLRSADMKPFIGAIQAGVGSIMTAHVVYPSLDPTKPGTLSYPVLSGLLRGELGFSGPIFTDDLGMGAISEIGGIGSAGVQAVRAGADGLLVCRHLQAVREVVDHLEAACQEDEAFASRCVESRKRLEAAASAFPPRPQPLHELAKALGTAQHRALAERVRANLPEAGADGDPTAYDSGRA